MDGHLLGATDEELKETMAIAMKVGANKIRMLQERLPWRVSPPEKCKALKTPNRV